MCMLWWRTRDWDNRTVTTNILRQFHNIMLLWMGNKCVWRSCSYISIGRQSHPVPTLPLMISNYLELLKSLSFTTIFSNIISFFHHFNLLNPLNIHSTPFFLTQIPISYLLINLPNFLHILRSPLNQYPTKLLHHINKHFHPIILQTQYTIFYFFILFILLIQSSYLCR